MDPIESYQRLITEMNAETVEQFRHLVFNYAHAHPEEIDVRDVENRIASPDKLQSDENMADVAVRDWMLKRLLASAKEPLTLHSALEKFVEIFQFRTQWKVAELSLENTLPIEFFKVVPFIADGADRDGYRLFIIRLKFYRKINQFDVLIKRAMIYLVEQQDILFEKYQPFKGVCIFMDFQDFNYRHADLNMLRFIVQLGFKFPGSVRKILVYKLPWALKVFLQLTEKLLDSALKVIKLHIIDQNNISDFIDSSELPVFLGGNRPVKVEVPQNAVPFLEMTKSIKEIDEASAREIQKYIQELL